MTQAILDTARHSAFLAQAGARERSAGRLIVFLLLAVPLSVLASVVAVGLVTAVPVLMGHPVEPLVAALTGNPPADRPLISYGFEFSVAGLSLFAMAAVWIALAARIYGRPMRSFLTAAPRFRWRLVGLGMAVAAPLVVVALLIEVWSSGGGLEPPLLRATDWTEALGYAAFAAAFLFLAALAEEMFFRGWLLQQTAVATRNIVVILIVNGVLFSAIHLDPNPGAFVVRAAMGIGWAWIALRLGGVEFGAGAHLANNLAVSLLAQPLSLKPPTDEAADPAAVLVQLGIVAVTVAAVEFGVNLNKRGRIAAPR